MELFQLMGTIAVNNSDANKAIDTTTTKASNFGKNLSDGIKTVGKWGTAIVGGASVAVGGLVKFAQSSASTADNIDKMSQKIGISRQAYQELDFICSQSGTSVDGLQAGMKTLTTAMVGASQGTKANVAQFEKLGVAVTNADGSMRSQEEVFFDTVSALQGMENQTEKARLATQLFGKSGTELMPLLNGASGSIEEMKKQAHDLGLVLDDDVIDNGVELTDSIDQTKRAFGSIVTQLGGSLMPIVTQASDYIQKSMPTIQSMISGLAPVITSLFSGLLPPLMDLAQQIFPVLVNLMQTLLPPITQIVQAVLPIIVQLVQMLLPPIIQIVQAVLPILVNILNLILPLLQPILNLLQPILNLITLLLPPLTDLINSLLVPLINIIVQVATALATALQPVMEAMATFISNVLNKAIASIKTVLQPIVQFCVNFVTQNMGQIQAVIQAGINVIKGIISFFTALFKGDWQGMWEAVKSIVSAGIAYVKNLFNLLKTFFVTIGTNLATVVKEKFEAIKTGMQEKIESAKETVLGIFDNIRDGIETRIEKAKEIVHSIIEKIKGFFNFTFELPKIKLPHFSVKPSGWKLSDLLKGTIPSLGIEWYAKAMDNPMLMTKPTAFGVNGNGQVMAGGEAGAEIVSGADKLMDMISGAVAVQNATLVNVLGKILEAILAMDENMGGNLRDALDGTSLSVNNREFARLVKAVN